MIFHASRLCILDLLRSRSSAGRDSRTELQLQFDGQPARHPEPDPIRTSNGTLSSGADAHAALERRCQDCNGTIIQGGFGVCPPDDCPTAQFSATGAALATEQAAFAGTIFKKWPRDLATRASRTYQFIRSRGAIQAKKKKLCWANFPCKTKLEWSRLRQMPIISVATIGTEQR